MDEYACYEELKHSEREGLDYRILHRPGVSGIMILAIHGGGIEPGTSEIAEAVAGDIHGFYSFSGDKGSDNQHLHISSRRFDEPVALKAAGDAVVSLTIHGCRAREEVVYVGGRHKRLMRRIAQRLKGAGIEARESERFPGRHPLNICNRCRSGRGVQLEVSFGLRRRLFPGFSEGNRENRSDAFFRFVGALSDALRDPADWTDIGEQALPRAAGKDAAG
jgi:phage replication-related protein YjqB (UPF0714/DUF867 family)